MPAAVSVVPLGNPAALAVTPSSNLVGNGVWDDAAALQAQVNAAGSYVLDLNGRTYYTSAPLELPNAGLRLCNGKILSGTTRALHVTGADVTVRDMAFERSAGAGGATASDERSLVHVAATGFRSLNCDYTNAALACLYLAAGSCARAQVLGGHFRNSAAVQNACAIWVAPGVFNDHIQLHPGVVESTGCPDGILAFDVRGCRISGEVFGQTELPTLTLTGWTLFNGSVYRTLDRTDGLTRALFQDGVQQDENVATPTVPIANEWGISGGYVYIHGNPAAQTITSKIVSGYGITVYGSTASLPCSDNQISGYDIHDTDGFGIYLQLTPTGSSNNIVGPGTLRDVCTSGVQTVSLPFAGIGVAGGDDTLIDGARLYTVGTGAGAQIAPGIHVANSGTGRIVGTTVRSSKDVGFYIRSAGWRLHGCKARGCGNFGFYATGYADTVFDTCDADNAAAARIVGGLQLNSRGAGTPLSVVTAEPGSTFLRTDGAAGTSSYVKHTSSADADWTALS